MLHDIPITKEGQEVRPLNLLWMETNSVSFIDFCTVLGVISGSVREWAFMPTLNPSVWVHITTQHQRFVHEHVPWCDWYKRLVFWGSRSPLPCSNALLLPFPIYALVIDLIGPRCYGSVFRTTSIFEL